MLRISVLSPKGGVGKTAFAANLAASLTEQAGKMLAVDLDPQNALRLHFGIDPSDETGLGRNALDGVPWQEATLRSKYGVDVLPFGELGMTDETDVWHAAGGLQLIEAILSDPLFNGYASAVIDAPPGPTPILRKMIAISDLVFVVLSPDAASFACIPAMKRLLQERDDGQPIKGRHPYYILNQMDARRRLHCDVRALMGQVLGDWLLDFYIHSDVSLSEALAQQQPVLRYAPHAQSAKDFRRLAQWLGEQLVTERAVG
ncbi:MAG: cellulose biosynthesis protein BcsQ [Gammaproteobacteria bacterium]